MAGDKIFAGEPEYRLPAQLLWPKKQTRDIDFESGQVITVECRHRQLIIRTDGTANMATITTSNYWAATRTSPLMSLGSNVSRRVLRVRIWVWLDFILLKNGST